MVLEQPSITKHKGIVIGYNAKTKLPVYRSYSRRSLNTMILGSVGSGRFTKLVFPMIKQDLSNLVSLINTNPRLEPIDSEQEFINGISIIDSSGDICDQTVQLLQAYNIPMRAVTYIDPLDSETIGINIMQGPAKRVADILSELVIDEIYTNQDEKSSFFYAESQRNHLRYYIYLLKLYNKDEDVTFDMLLDMYNDPQMVHRMHKQLKHSILESRDRLVDSTERKHWEFVQSIDEWFDSNLFISPKRQSSYLPSNMTGKDVLEGIVADLRLTLCAIGANPYFRRVLMGDGKFDFDRHVKNGGILLVNTAKNETGCISSFIGKFFLKNLHQARLNDIPNEMRFFHHILIDDLPNYFYKSFVELTMQSRPLKMVVTTILQTLNEIKDHSNINFFLGPIQNRLVCGCLSIFDAEFLFERLKYDQGILFQDEILSIETSIEKLTPKYLNLDGLFGDVQTMHEHNALTWLNNK